MLLGVNRYQNPKAPAILVWHPQSEERTEVPPGAFGIRRDDNVRAYGTGKKGSEPFVSVLHDDALKSLPWAAITALPRTR